MIVGGHPDKQEEDREYLHDCLAFGFYTNFICSVLKRNQIQHVVVVDGGFFAIHEYLFENDRLDWLVDHDERVCPVCEYHKLKHMMSKMKATVSQTAQNVATKAVSTLQKMQENISKQDPAEFKSSLKDVQDSISSLGMKGKSLFSKALSWTREKSLQIVEDVNKRSKHVNANSHVVEAVQQEQENHEAHSPVFTVEESE